MNVEQQIELGRQVAAAGIPQDEDEAAALGAFYRHEAATAKAERQVMPKPVRRTLRLNGALAEAAAVLGNCRPLARSEAVDFGTTEGLRRVLGIRVMPAGVALDIAAENNERHRRDKAIEKEVARLTRESGTLAAEAYRAAQHAPAAPREPTVDERANATVEAALTRVRDAMYRSIAMDGAFGDAPLRVDHQWSATDGAFGATYEGPADSLGVELRRRMSRAQNLAMQGFSADFRDGARRVPSAQPVDVRGLVGIYAIPCSTVTAWLSDPDIQARYNLGDILASE